MKSLIQKLRELEASEEVAGEAANELSALREKVAQLAEQQQKAIGVIEVVTEDGKVTVPAYAAPVVPDGMVMVPREPTEKMILAGDGENHMTVPTEYVADIWKAMIAAAQEEEK